MEWKELQKDKAKLCELLNEYSRSQIDNELDLEVSGRQVQRWANKNGISRIDGIWYIDDDIEEIEYESAEDRNIKVTETEWGYLVNHDKWGLFETTDEEINDLRFYYCNQGLPQDTVAKKLDKIHGTKEQPFTYEKFKAIKIAFHIVHKSLPYTDRTIKNEDPEELADKLIEREDKEFTEIYRLKKLDALEKENKQLKKKKYIVEEVIKKLLPEVREMRYEPPKFNYVPSERSCDYQVMTVDLHIGKVVFGDSLLGQPAGYNTNKLMERVDKYLNEVIYGIRHDKPKKIYFVDLGDTADGRKIYEGQEQHQELYGHKQCVKAADTFEYMLKKIHSINKNIEFIKISGNHQRNDDGDLLIGELVKRGMRKYQHEIKFDVEDREYKVRKIRGFNHIYTHGNNFRNGTYTREADVVNTIQLMELHDKYTYIHQGHLHHLAKEGARHNHWKWPSIVGGDWLGNNAMQKGARACQIFLRLTNDGMSGINPVHFD